MTKLIVLMILLAAHVASHAGWMRVVTAQDGAKLEIDSESIAMYPTTVRAIFRVRDMPGVGSLMFQSSLETNTCELLQGPLYLRLWDGQQVASGPARKAWWDADLTKFDDRMGQTLCDYVMMQKRRN